ncbi:MAG: mucoidy inhibitor MuiA family protein, partial [Deltaproteobacteria bacterium]|nr:mucoidy inhibitor MuiA family protein [Deltaproteobacteria bacterium]
MRTLTILFTLVALCSFARAAGKVSQVVVYGDRAQVTRVTPASCQKGLAKFSGLPSTLDTNTLRASAKGAQVLGVTWKEEASGPREKAKALQKKIKALDVKIVAQSAIVSATYSTGSRLGDLRQHMKRVWGVQARGKRPAIGSWNGALDLLRKERLANQKRRREAQSRTREFNRERAELYRQMGQLNRQRRRTTYQARVMLRCKGGSPQVELNYVVPGATWRVSYQARADTQGRKVTLVAQAIIQQGTGEDWENVKLAVSTANLRRKNTPPSLRRMRVSTYEPVSKKKILQRRFERRRHLKAKVSGGTLATGKKDQGGKTGKEPGLAMQLPAARRVTIPSDGREVLVTLASVTRRANFAYETVPKLFPFVYHRLELHNPFGFPMMPGPIALYRNGTFTGRT